MAGMIAEMEACIPALRRYAAALLRDHQEAEDLVHDCLAFALERLHTWREDGQIRAWLLTILRNLYIGRVGRVKVRDIAVPIDVADETVFVTGARQNDYAYSRDLMGAFGRLTIEQRTVLLLVAVEGLSYAEVARIEGVPIATVMSRLSRARETLRRETCAVPPSALRRVT